MANKPGWTGRVFEDFEIGDVYAHPLGRTILPTDNAWFTLVTQNSNPIHVDHLYASRTEFKRPLVNSCFTLSLVTGQSVTDVSQNVMANLGWDEIRLPHPVFEGDTIYSQSEVLEKRASKSRHNVGIITVKSIGFNQDGIVVIEFRRTMMVYRRGHVRAGRRRARRRGRSMGERTATAGQQVEQLIIDGSASARPMAARSRSATRRRASRSPRSRRRRRRMSIAPSRPRRRRSSRRPGAARRRPSAAGS